MYSLAFPLLKVYDNNKSLNRICEIKKIFYCFIMQPFYILLFKGQLGKVSVSQD